MRYFIPLLLSLTALTGCQTAYYSAMEKVGYHKRDIMIDRVEEAKTSQQKAQQEFKSALESLSALTHFDGGDLETMYNKVNDEYQDSEQAVKEVHQRIDAIEDVSEALFSEWQDELELYTNANLRRSSEQTLRQTQSAYHSMLTAMQHAEQKMTPVLNTLRDNTLFLKHNLNATAIDSLQGEFAGIEQDVQHAIEQMSLAIAESERFLSHMHSTK